MPTEGVVVPQGFSLLNRGVNMQLFSQDPITTTWMIALLVLFIIVVVVPLIRALAAGAIYAYAHASGRHHLRATAARVMPRIGHLIGSVVVGVASIAAPAAAAETQITSHISVDRDGGVIDVAGKPDSTSVSHLPPTAQPPTAPEAVAVPETAATSHLYVVKTGDTLWDIAASRLQSPTDAEITEQWKAIWRANRQVIGAHPEFIRPGMELVLDGGAS